MGGFSEVVNLAYPELKQRHDFSRQIISDLHSKGLTNSDSSVLSTMMTVNGMLAGRLSQMGMQFLDFISEPSHLR